MTSKRISPRRGNPPAAPQPAVDEAADESGSASEVKTAATATQILEALGAAGGPITLSALARRIGMNKSRVWRYLSTMCALELVERSPDDTYELGLRILRLGQIAAERYSITETAYPFLQVLRDTLGYQCYLAIPTEGGASVVAILQQTNVSMLALSTPPGTYLSATTSTAGRIFLAFMEEHDLLETLAHDRMRDKPLQVLRRELEPTLQRIRHEFFDVNVNAQNTGGSILSVPVFDHREKPIAVLSVTIAAHVSAQDLRTVGDSAKATARAISVIFGSSVWETVETKR